MTLSNVKLILAREIRDQLRDRRTLFMVAVLPILLYPLLGMSLFQVSQFMQEQATRVLVVGAPDIPDLPPLFANQQFAEQLFTDPSRARLLTLYFAFHEPPAWGETMPDAKTEAYGLVQSGKYEAALYFPPDFAGRLDAFREAIHRRAESRTEGKNVAQPPSAVQNRPGQPGAAVPQVEVRLEVPSPEILYSTANDKSQIAHARLLAVLDRWTQRISDDNLATSGVSRIAMQPFLVESADVADADYRGASMWSKILPVLLLLWALTGAFYPAVDLCAGEKERGTLETLLCSPAARSEIVVGKLATIMLFSIVTAVLNLLSVGITGWMVAAQLPGFGLPPLTAIAALMIALVPISALFSALCLALAAFARSTKEGQYYLMPLLLATMPLVILPMSPGVELNLGNSLIPVTGVVLLLRSVLEGNYWQAAQFSPVVAAVTLTACLLSIRWAVDQFNSESVLFREGERLDVGLWLRHLLRDRKATPNVTGAVFCSMVIILVRFFMSFSMTQPGDFGGFARMALITQLVVILTPVLLMTVILTSSPRATLLLKFPAWRTIPAALFLAVFLHPLVNVLQTAVTELYPVSEGAKNALADIQQMLVHANIWQLLLVIAIVPAICEELAFRGFILSGFRHIGYKWRAIVLSAFFFGIIHGVLQQSLLACLVGVVLGYLAVQSSSILPCMVFHLAHNSLAVLNCRLTPALFDHISGLESLIIPGKNGGCTYSWSVVVFGSLAGLLLMIWFGLLPYQKTPEEELQQAIARGEIPDKKDEDISASLASLFE